MLEGTEGNVDTSISGWTRGSSRLAQGLVPLMLLASPQFDPGSQLQAQVLEAVRAPVVTPVPVKFVRADQQQYVDSPSIVIESLFSGAKPRVPPFTSAAPEQIDLSISGWSRGTTRLPRGPIPFVALVTPQPDLTQVSSIWSSVRTPAAVFGRLPLPVLTTPQPDLTQVAQIFRSVSTPPALTSGILPPFTTGAPEQVDLSISGWSRGVSVSGGFITTTGRVPPFTKALSEPVDLSISGWSRGVSLSGGPATFPGARPPFTQVHPQPNTRQDSSAIWGPVVAQGQSVSAEFKFGGHAVALYNAEAQKSDIWAPIGGTPPTSGPTIRQIQGAKAPQAYDHTLPAVLTRASVTPPPIFGPTIAPLHVLAPPQEDISGNGTVVWTPATFTEAVPNLGGRLHRIKDARLVLRQIVTKTVFGQVIVTFTSELPPPAPIVIPVYTTSKTAVVRPIFTTSKVSTVHALVNELDTDTYDRRVRDIVKAELAPVIAHLQDLIKRADERVDAKVQLTGIESGMKLRKVKASGEAVAQLTQIVTLTKFRRPDVSLE